MVNGYAPKKSGILSDYIHFTSFFGLTTSKRGIFTSTGC